MAGKYEKEIAHRAAVWADGVAALSVFVGMKTCQSALQAMSNAGEDFLLRSVLFSGFVVAYSRSFERATHQDTGISRSFSVKKIEEPFDKTIHDALLTLRNQQIAHSDHVLNDYNLTFLTAKKTVRTVSNGGNEKEVVERIPIGTRARASIACGILGVEQREALVRHVGVLHNIAAERLAIAIVEHDKASIFRLHELAVDSSAAAKTLKSYKVQLPEGGVAVFSEDDLLMSFAKAPEALPLEFAIMHLNVVESGGSVSLRGRVGPRETS